jgi:hypothetical protein
MERLVDTLPRGFRAFQLERDEYYRIRTAAHNLDVALATITAEYDALRAKVAELEAR